METHTCPLCSEPRPDTPAAAVTWSSQREPDGTTTWVCPACTRSQLWSIEAGIGVTPPAPAGEADRAA